MENLENKIKDKLQHSEISVDTNELWNEVYPHIKPKRNRKIILFLMVGVLWLISLVAVGYYYQPNKVESKKVVSLALEQDNSGSEEIINTNEIKVEEKALGSPSLIKSSDVESIESKKRKKAHNVKKSFVIEAKSAANVIDKPNSGLQLNQKIKNNQSSSFQPLFEQQEIESLDQNHRLEYEEKSKHVGLPNFDKVNKVNIKIAATGNLSDEIENKNNSRLSVSTVMLKKSVSRIAFNYPQPIIPDEFYAEYKPQTNFSKFSVYATGGLSTISRSINLRENMTSLDLEQRVNSESPLESLSGQLGLSYSIRPNLVLSAGLNYIRINEKIEDSYSVTDTVLLENVIIENIISSRGSEPVFGNIQSERTVNTNLKAYNKYSDIAISLDLTYLLTIQSIRPYLSAGVQQSISSNQTGYWLLNDNDLYDISQDSRSYLSSKYGLGLRLGAGVSIDISDRSSIIIGGQYTKYLNSISSDAYSLKQKYNLLGLSAGLNIKI